MTFGTKVGLKLTLLKPPYVVTAQGGGWCWKIHTVKIAVHSAEDCCTATTMAPTYTEKCMLTNEDVHDNVIQFGVPFHSHFGTQQGENNHPTSRVIFQSKQGKQRHGLEKP